MGITRVSPRKEKPSEETLLLRLLLASGKCFEMLQGPRSQVEAASMVPNPFVVRLAFLKIQIMVLARLIQKCCKRPY